jgi:hypothetical protein
LALGVGAGPVLDPGVGAANVAAVVGDDAAAGVPTTTAALAFASFFSSLRFFLSSRACADSSTSEFIFHWVGGAIC